MLTYRFSKSIEKTKYRRKIDETIDVIAKNIYHVRDYYCWNNHLKLVVIHHPFSIFTERRWNKEANGIREVNSYEIK